jgi:hypothetical protein
VAYVTFFSKERSLYKACPNQVSQTELRIPVQLKDCGSKYDSQQYIEALCTVTKEPQIKPAPSLFTLKKFNFF